MKPLAFFLLSDKLNEGNKMTKEVRPWDLMHPSTPRASGTRAAERLAVCKQCPQFTKALQQCKICKCIMPMKVTLEMATCPENRWDDHSQ